MNNKCFLTIALFLASLSIPGEAKDAPVLQKLSFTTHDGIRIVGVYRAPSAGKATVILLHGLGSTKEEWTGFEKLLEEKGFGYYSYDARGHGESSKDTAGGSVDYKEFGRPGINSPWYRMIGDLNQAVTMLAEKKNLRKRTIGIIGASLGANVALACAAGQPSVPFIVLLSPGQNYAGIETPGPLRSYGKRELLIAASPDDTYAWQSSQALCRLSPHATLLQGPGGHGVQMFDGTFENRLLRELDALISPRACKQ